MSIDPVSQHVPVALQAAVPATSSPAHPDLGDKFTSLMARAPMAPPDRADTQMSSVVSKAVEAQDAQFQQDISDLSKLSDDMPQMSMAEITDHSIKMMFEMANMQMNMQVKMSLAESSKSSVQTLMKNQ